MQKLERKASEFGNMFRLGSKSKVTQEHHPSEENIRGYKADITIKGLDHKSRVTSTEEGDHLEIVASQIKMVNIPCMFDLGLTPVNPCDQQLNLNIMDDITFHEVKKKIGIKKKIPKK